MKTLIASTARSGRNRKPRGLPMARASAGDLRWDLERPDGYASNTWGSASAAHLGDTRLGPWPTGLSCIRWAKGSNGRRTTGRSGPVVREETVQVGFVRPGL